MTAVNDTSSTVKAPIAARLIPLAQAFLDGLIIPSRKGFFAMLAGIAVMVGTLNWFFDYETLAGPNGAYLVRSSADSDGAATYRALQVGGASDTDPLLIVLGSSITASAFASETMLETALSQATDMNWQVAMLTTALQSPIDQITLIQAALGPAPESRRHVVILLGVDVTHTGWSTQQILEVDAAPRLGVRSEWADAEINRLGGDVRPRSPQYLFENSRFFAVNGTEAMLRLMMQRSAKRRYDLFAPKAFLPDDERKRQLISDQIRTSIAPTDPGFLPVLESLDGRLDQLGLHNLILMQELPSPALLLEQELGDAIVAEGEIYGRFADGIGAQHWPLFQEVTPSAQDYFDDLHIGAHEIQSEFRSALANRVRDLIGDTDR